MKVKPGKLSKVLGLTPAAITMALKRGSLNKTLDGLIDLEDRVNYNWIYIRLTKQGCEIPQKISTLFQATPITESEKGAENNNNLPAAQLAPETIDNCSPVIGPQEIEKSRAAKEITETQRKKDRSLSDKAFEQAAQEKIKTALMRRELIKINPFGRLLFNIKAAERTQILSAIPNISQQILDNIKSALTENKSDTEILFKLQADWQAALEKIFEAIDRELKNKIRQAKDKLMVIDDSNEIEAQKNVS